MSVKEGNLLKKIMLQHTAVGRLFRCNTGSGWIGKSKALKDGTVLIRNARKFSTGWPVGTPDLIGFTQVKITPEMVGETLAVFTGIEGKTGKLKPTTAQTDFLNIIKQLGGISTVAYSENDIIKSINKFMERFNG